MSDALRAFAARLSQPPKPEKDIDRPTTIEPADVRWKRMEADALRREAEMLGVDVDLERAGR